MSTTASTPGPAHPLLDDPERWERTLDVMWDVIHKVLKWTKPTTRPTGGAGDGADRAIVGTGVGAEDILGDAIEGLLKFPPDRLESSWEGLAVTIAANKARDALTRAGKGLRETDRRARLRLVSGDQPAAAGDDDSDRQPSILEVYPDLFTDPEAEFLALSDLRELRDLARELLSERDLKVFLDVHCGVKTRKELGEELGITGQRVGQIYDDALDRLEVHPRFPYRDDADNDEGGHDEQGT